jgi:hypothetical protein
MSAIEKGNIDRAPSTLHTRAISTPNDRRPAAMASVA